LADQIEHTIHDTQELKDLLSNHKISFHPQKGKITLLYDHLSKTERQNWEDKLSRYYFECGCDIGSKFAIVFLFLYLIFIFVIAGISSILEWQTIVYGIVFVVIGAVLGKIFGLVYYKYLLNSAVKKLLKRAKIESEIL
jgi:hypothetical protein